MQKGLSPILMILILAGAVVLVMGGYYFGTKRTETFQERLSRQNPMVFPSQNPQVTNKPSVDTSTLINTTDENASWKIYTASACKECKKFSFLYPPIYQVSNDYMPSGLGKVLVDSEGAYIDHYPLSNEEITKVVTLGVNTQLNGYKAFEQTVVNADKSGLYEISLLDFPEKGQGQKFLYETKKDIIHQITEFKKILQTITVN